MSSLVPDIVIVFSLNEERKTLAYQRVPFTTWQELKTRFGFTPGNLLSALAQKDVEAIGALIWLERRQHDRKAPWAAVYRQLEADEVEFAPIDVIVDGEGSHESPPEQDPDPTRAGS